MVQKINPVRMERQLSKKMSAFAHVTKDLQESIASLNNNAQKERMVIPVRMEEHQRGR